MGGKEGGREAYRVVKNPGGNRQGVRRGVQLPQGIDTPAVDELPREEETPVVATKGEGVPGGYGWGRVGEVKPPTTRATQESRAGG